MSTQQEHEMIPRIRDWLDVTEGVDISVGLARNEARDRALELLTAIVIGDVNPKEAELSDDIKDVIWALVIELESSSVGRDTFEQCDRAYQFVSAIEWENDSLGERDEILHIVARIGWRSAPGGMEVVVGERNAVWEHGDEQRHREICETASELPNRLANLRNQPAPDIAEIREICARLFKLASVQSISSALNASALFALLDSNEHRIGYLDEREYFKASSCLVASLAGRQLGNWALAESNRALAASSFRRTAIRADLERVEGERLALMHVRGNNEAVCKAAPDVIARGEIARERVKAQLVLGSAMLSLNRPREARPVLEAALRESVTASEPALRVGLLTKLGTAFAYLCGDDEAMGCFYRAALILRDYYLPLQSADLTASVGEHLGRLGNFEGAAVLYTAAREKYRQAGQAQSVGYISVLLAEVLMMLEKDQAAEDQLLTALPLIDRLDLRQEALAAVTLLRETMARRSAEVNASRARRDRLWKSARF